MIRIINQLTNNPIGILAMFFSIIVVGFHGIGIVESKFVFYLAVSCLFVTFSVGLFFHIHVAIISMKLMFYIYKNKKTINSIEKFTIRDWCNLLNINLSRYQKILLLKIYTERGAFVKKGNYYYFNEEKEEW